jgi:cytochrome c peroxidase
MRCPRWAAPWALLGALCALPGCGGSAESISQPPDDSENDVRILDIPSDFPARPEPDDNAVTLERVQLGRRLFYDTRLSRTGQISCASCHVQANAFSDPNRTSLGVDGLTGTRNAVALVNEAWNTSFFWDGGVPSLELQAVGPIKNPLEMDMTLAEVNDLLAADAEISARFQAAYAEGPSERTLPRALASFVRVLVSGDSAYDRFRRGDTAALSDAASRGRAIFEGERGQCTHCHVGFNFTNNGFRNNGTRPDDPDPGRQRLTLKDADFGKFRVPSLRNVALSAPYMHDGSLATLEAVVDHYNQGGNGSPNTDPTLHPLGLSQQEKADLIAFLESLTDEAFLADGRLAAPR